MTAHRYVTADIKTGKLLVDFGLSIKYPVQLACYRDGQPYDTETDTRGEPIPTHPDVAFIYHYDLAAAINGEPVDWQIIPVNLDAGRQGGDIARQHAEWSARSDMFGPPIRKDNPCDTESPQTAESSLISTTVGQDEDITPSCMSSETTNSTSSPTASSTTSPPATNASSTSSATTHQEPDPCATDTSTEQTDTSTSSPTPSSTTTSPSSMSSPTTNSSSSPTGSSTPTAATAPDDPSPNFSPNTSETTRRDRLKQRYNSLPTDAQLRFIELISPDSTLDDKERALDQVDPFAHVTPLAERALDVPAEPSDPPASEAMVAAVITAVADSPWRAVINEWVAEAHANGHAFNPKKYPTTVNVLRTWTAYETCRAAKGDGAIIRATLQAAFNPAELDTDDPAHSIGSLIGRLTAEQCATVRALAEAI